MPEYPAQSGIRVQCIVHAWVAHGNMRSYQTLGRPIMCVTGQQLVHVAGPKGEGGLDDATGAGGAGGASMKQSSGVVDLGKHQMPPTVRHPVLECTFDSEFVHHSAAACGSTLPQMSVGCLL